MNPLNRMLSRSPYSTDQKVPSLRRLLALFLFALVTLGIAQTASAQLAVSTSSVPGGTVGLAYSTTLSATGGVAPFSWVLRSGNLPPGIGLSADGLLSGTPYVVGSYTFTVRVTDAAGSRASLTMLQAVAASSPPPSASALAIPYPGIDPGAVGVAYSKAYTASGGVPPYVWNVSAGTMAPGMALSSTGVLNGTPTAAGTYNFQMTVTDSASNQASASEALYIAAAAGSGAGNSGSTNSGGTVGMTTTGTTPPTPLAIPYPGIDPGTVGAPYSKTYGATGGLPPYAWRVSSGAVAPGMSLSPAGTLGGTPTQGGDFQFQMTVTDAASSSVTVSEDLYIGGDSTSGGPNSGSGSANPPPAENFILSVINGTIAGGASSASEQAGSAVTISAGAAPAGEFFQAWTGAAVASAGSPTTTITMPAANATVTATFSQPIPVPFPVSSHPRLWITPQDLPRLQSWATPGNPAYAGMAVALNQAIENYGAAFPGSALDAVNPAPASPYPDIGDTNGYTGILSEENAVILAFNSLIDPNPANRPRYAQAARNLLMYAMNQAALGPQTGAPFRDPAFALYNRASWSGHDWPLVVDWIYPILTASDKATIRAVFLNWAAGCLTASTTGGDNPGSPGVVNSLSLLPNNKPYRMASNNYFLAHARLLTMISLALDPADDPSINPVVAPNQIGNSLRSYIQDATGAWLYEEYAMMGEPTAVAQAYQLPGNPTGAGFGLASGGLPPEGMLYGESFGYILQQLLSLQTAGFNNPAYSGPQIQLIGSPVWDRYVTGYFSSLTPSPFTPPAESWLGSVYQVAAYGDVLRLWETPDHMEPFSLLALLEQEAGTSAHVNDARWYALNAMPNGAAGLSSRMESPWTWGVTQDLLYFMLLDPSAPAAPDPRPSFPTTFYDAPAARIVAHSDWGPANTMFDYRAGWISINHQDGAAGMFGLYRKGEWLTKPMANYDSGGNGGGATTTYLNSLALQNWTAASVTWQGLDGIIWANGSQWMEGENAGDPTTIMSTGPGYVYAASDLTNLFNRPDTWSPLDSVSDITQATRSILWLNNDYIVVYDRATSVHPGLFKRFNLSLVANPAVNGNAATEALPSGQQLFIQTLLPLSPSLTSFNGAANLTVVADLEPTQFVYQVQDPTNPADTRFLHVLQGADQGVAMVPAVYRQSMAGTAFDGAEFGGNDVWFPVSGNGGFSSTTLPASAAVSTVLVTGLTPNGSYGVSAAPGSSGNLISITAGPGNATADAAGVLRITLGN